MNVSLKIVKPFTRGRRFCLAGMLALLALAWSGAAAAAPPAVINLQARPANIIAKEKGFLKEEFDSIGVKEVNLVATGTAELYGAESAAVAGGALAVAHRMIYPSVVHRANGLDVVLVWVSEPSNRYRTPVLAKKGNEAVRSVADLDGKKFGGARISCYWAAPLEILDKAGLPLDTRTRRGRVRHETIDNPAVMISALMSGATDATAGHLTDPRIVGAWLSGEMEVIGESPDDGIYVNHSGRVTIVAQRDFAEKYPEVIRAFLLARERGRHWAADHPNEAAAIIARELRLPVEAALFLVTHVGQQDFMGGEPNADRAVDSIKTFQAWYAEHGDDILGERRLTDEQVEAFVARQFFVGGQYSIYK